MTALAYALLALALVAAACWVALLYGGRRTSFDEPGRRGLVASAVGIVAALAAVAMIAVIIADHADSATAKGRHGEVALNASEQRGRDVFRHVCANCHTLAAARSSGDVGPDLDLIAPPADRTLRVIEHGSIGYTALMPANLIDGQEARDVAAYVARVARR